ncbi:unnamed protein product [Dovyalis caffra]|uniref:Uncharacterized protein n=1 Tax=Dovyalis caffra TaxID=77055 RepID=A0AAV1SIY3_9ROSI|nr:unnamed protein product [Dovyalis caffra]
MAMILRLGGGGGGGGGGVGDGDGRSIIETCGEENLQKVIIYFTRERSWDKGRNSRRPNVSLMDSFHADVGVGRFSHWRNLEGLQRVQQCHNTGFHFSFEELEVTKPREIVLHSWRPRPTWTMKSHLLGLPLKYRHMHAHPSSHGFLDAVEKAEWPSCPPATTSHFEKDALNHEYHENGEKEADAQFLLITSCFVIRIRSISCCM